MRVWDLVWLLRVRVTHTHQIPTPLPLHRHILLRLRACSSLSAHSAMIPPLSPSEPMSLHSATLVPASYAVRSALKAATELSDAEAARQVHGQAIATGLASDAGVAAALVRAYAHCGRVLDARQVFDGMRSRGVALWNAMVAGYAKVGDVENARKVFECMPERDLISWTSVIAGFARAKRPREAVGVFGRMLLENVEPDGVAMLAVLSACALLGSLELGERLHCYVVKRGFCGELRIKNALVDMYAKSGSVGKALDVFKSAEEKSVVTWTTMISGLALHGLGREASEMFSRMESALVKPNEITFVALLSACSHAGLVEMGHWYFNNMASRYGVRPKIEHYGCIIDLLGRAGHLIEARELVTTMPFKANAAIWGSLLAASNVHGDAELGRKALHHLLVLEPHNSGNYMLLSNIYSAVGDWDESRMLRKVMRDAGIKKTPSGSFIEVNNKVHQFVAGDTSYSEFYRTFGVVCQIFNQLKIDAHLQAEIIELLEFHDFLCTNIVCGDFSSSRLMYKKLSESMLGSLWTFFKDLDREKTRAQVPSFVFPALEDNRRTKSGFSAQEDDIFLIMNGIRENVRSLIQLSLSTRQSFF